MLTASRRRCAIICRTIRPFPQPQRSLALSAAGVLAGNGAEHHVEQHRMPAQKTNTIRTANTFPRSLSTRKVNTAQVKTALRWLEQDKVERVVKLVADTVAEGDETHLLGELLQAIYASGNKKLFECFFAVLETLPDANSATSAPFRGVLDVIQASDPDSDLRTVQRLGILCATKGYGEFVESDISPLISEGCSRLQLAQWKQSVALALAKFKGLVIDVDQVFEDAEADYESVPVSSRTSVLQAVEETLPELLPHPTFSDETMVFEDHNDDYIVADSFTTDAQDHSISHTIQSLVRYGEFERAHRLLQELGDFTQVEPNLVYLEAASASINVGQYPNQEALAEMEGRLFDWLNLVPIHDDDITFYLPSMLKLLEKLENLPNLHFTLLVKVSLFLARKGYTRYLTTTFCRTIFVYGSPEVISSFITELEEVHRQYYLQDYRGENLNQEHKIKVFIRGNGIRELARRKEFDAAFALLPDPDRDSWSLTAATYGYLLDSLESPGHDAALRDHLNQFASDHPLTLEVRQILPRWFWEEGPRPGTTFRRPIVMEASSLAEDLKRFKAQAIESKTVAPLPTALVPTVKQCVTTGLTDDLTEVFNTACTYHWSLASSFISAEMLYYQKQGFPLEIIKTFVDHFHICGVPTLQVLQLSKQGQIQRIHDTSKLHIAHKLWPAKDHVSLVWHALATLATSTSEYFALYRRLREFVQHKGWDNDPSLARHGLRALAPPVNPMSSMAYTPFIRGLGWRIGTSQAKGVFNDMMKDGFKPTLVHFTQLANLYAREGRVKAAMLILESLEKIADGQKPAERQGFRQLGVKSFQVENECLDTVLYKTIFAGFVKSKKWLPAWMVHRAMARRFGWSKVMDDAAHSRMYGEAFHKAWSLFRKHGYPAIRDQIVEIEDAEARMQDTLRDGPRVPLHPPWRVQREQLLNEEGLNRTKPSAKKPSRKPVQPLPANPHKVKAKKHTPRLFPMKVGSRELEMPSSRLREALKEPNHSPETPPA